MEHLPSTSKEKIKEEYTRSLEDETFKGELTNALKYCNSLLQEKNLLTDTPPNKISSVSIAMGKVICNRIIEIFMSIERKVVAEDDLILFDESDSEGLFKEFNNDEDDYEPEEFQKPFNYISSEYKARTVALAEAYPKKSLATLHKKSCSCLKKKEDLKQWKEDVKRGGTSLDKWQHIDMETFDRFKEARASNKQFNNDEDDYEPEEFKKLFNYISLEYKARTVALAEAHPKWSLATLHKRGCSRLKRKEDLKQWKEDVKRGGTSFDKWQHIDMETFNRFKEARASNEQVTNRTIQQWAMTAAFPYISENFTFNASKGWMDKFKKRHGIKDIT